MLESIRQAIEAPSFLDFEVGGEGSAPPAELFGAWPAPLSADDIRQLEAQGCSAEDWSRVRLAPGADRAAIRRVDFAGRCLVGAVGGPDVELDGGVLVRAGIRDASLRDCVVGDRVVLAHCPVVHRADIQRDSVLVDCGMVAGGGLEAMGLDRAIAFGPETGGRSLAVFPGATSAQLAWLAERLGDAALQEAYRELCRRLCGRVRRSTVLVGAGSRLWRVGRILRSALAPGTCAYGAAAIEDCVLAGTPESPVRVGDGVFLARASANPGVRITGAAQCRDAHFCEASSVRDNGIVESAIVGENSSLGAGEVRHAFVGPFVAAHHQSLLIAVDWPGGRGNVGYGANAGSNHSGKAADLEARLGEGCFLGLGSVVKYPFDTSAAPFTLVASGARLLPMRLAIPFSLVAEPSASAPGLPPAYAELLPGWMLGRCWYGLLRAQWKFAARNKARPGIVDARAFRPGHAVLALDAADRLEAAGPPAGELPGGEGFHLEAGLPGIGKCFVRESARVEGIAWLREGAERLAAACVADLLDAGAQDGDDAVRAGLGEAARLVPPNTSAARWAAGKLREAVASAREDIARDIRRGGRIIADFAERRDPSADHFLDDWSRRAARLAGD